MTGSWNEPSLHLGFDLNRTDVVLRAGQQHYGDLAQLAARMGAAMRDRAAAALPLDTFLAGLVELSAWPDPEGVEWEPALMELAESVLEDAERAEQRLADMADVQAAGEIDPSDVVGILGSEWCADLTGFQRRNIARLLSLRHGADFSVPGAGKTREALAVYAALREQGQVARVLVVCPKSAYGAWRLEARECFTQPPRVEVMDSSPSPMADLLLVNYERLDRSMTSLAGWLAAAPSMLVLDEAHRMKLGPRGVYGAACMSLGPLARRRMILTGTPAPNGSGDLENLLGFVWPGHGRQAVVRAVAGGDLAYASRVLKPLYTRTTKAELGLPPVDLKIARVQLTGLHREIYDALVGRYSARAALSRDRLDSLGRAMLRLLMAATSPALLVEGSSRYDPLDYQVPRLAIPPDDPLHTLLESLPRYEIAPKHHEVLAIVRQNAEAGRKTLVWSAFVRNLATLDALLADFQPAMVHGGTGNRDEQIRRFREDPDCMVLISNPATLGEGISLHRECHDAVYLDRDFQAGRFLQSLDRIHRLGLAPDTHTRITVLAAEETIDDVVTDRLRLKLDFMGTVLDDPEVRQLADLEEAPAVTGGMDAADIQALLEHVSAGALTRAAREETTALQ